MFELRQIVLCVVLFSLCAVSTAQEEDSSANKVKVLVAQLLPLSEVDIMEMTNPHKLSVKSENDCAQCHGDLKSKLSVDWRTTIKG